MYGLTEEQIAQWGLTFGVGAFILYMMFIIVQLARESKAGKFGTFVLFLVLGFGLLMAEVYAFVVLLLLYSIGGGRTRVLST